MRTKRLFGFGDGAAGYARRGGAAGASGYSVNDNGGTTVAEDRVFIRAEGNVWRDGGDVSGTIGSDDE